MFNLAGTRHIENRFLAINQQPIAQFQLNIAVFHIIAAMKQIPAFHITYFCFSNAVWVSASGGFGIVSNTFLFIVDTTVVAVVDSSYSVVRAAAHSHALGEELRGHSMGYFASKVRTQHVYIKARPHCPTPDLTQLE